MHPKSLSTREKSSEERLSQRKGLSEQVYLLRVNAKIVFVWLCED